MRVCVDKPLAAHTRTHTGKWRDHRSQAANTQATTNNHHTNTHQTSLMVVTHTGWSLTHQGQAGQGAQQDQGSGGNGLHSDHAMAQACNTSGHATMACAPSPRATHASGHVHTHPLSHHTHKRERKEELGEGPQGVERHSGVSETVPLCHPPCPQVSTPPTVRPASPPPGPPSTTHPPPVSEWRHRRVRVWRHTRHTVWCNQHSQPPLSHSHKCPHQHTPTTNPPHAHTHTRWMGKAWMAHTGEESEKTRAWDCVVWLTKHTWHVIARTHTMEWWCGDGQSHSACACVCVRTKWWDVHAIQTTQPPLTHTQHERAATKPHATHTMCVCEAEEWAVDDHSGLVVCVCDGDGGWRRGKGWWLVVGKAQEGG